MIKRIIPFIITAFLLVNQMKSNDRYSGNKPENISQDNADFKIKKNPDFKNTDLEAIYNIKYLTKKEKRDFQIIKTNTFLRNYFLANFILVEKGNDGTMIFYPFAWEVNNISESELKLDCLRIINQEANPVTIN